MPRVSLLLPLVLFGCAHARQPEPPRQCGDVTDCERVYAEELAAYTACKDDHYGAHCEDEESRMNGAYSQLEAAKGRADTAEAAQEDGDREAAMAADRKAQQAEFDQVRQEREAVVAASRAEDERIEQERAAVEAAQQEETLARQEAAKAKAGDHGFDDIVLLETGGLAGYLRAAMHEGLDVTTLPKTVIELAPEDAALTARTVKEGEGVFISNGVVIFFRAPKGKVIYQGTPLTSLVEAVRITGVRPFKVPGAGTVQAFVVAPVW